MATARVGRIGRAPARVSARVPRAGRVPPARRGTSRLEARRGAQIIDTSKLSHVARRRIAQPPMAVVDRVGDAVHAAVLAWANRFIDAVMRKVVPDVVQDATSEDIDAILAALDDPTVAKALLDKAFASVDAASSDDLRVIGVQTSTVVRNAEDLQRKWIRESTDLIRATEDVRRRVERIVSDPVSQGRSVADIRKLLEEQAGYAASRAELTARTVTLQTYGKIQEQRQRDAGFTQYVWTTSLDERVREDHAQLDGTVQSWDDPPIVDSRTGRRGHPGSDFQCRCSAVPYVDPNEAEDIEAPAQAPAPAPIAAPARSAHRAPALVTEAVTEPPVPEAVKRDFFPTSEAGWSRLLQHDRDRGLTPGESPESRMVRRFVTHDFSAIRALQQGASVEDILARVDDFGPYRRPELEPLRDNLPALRRAQDLMSVENPTSLGPLYRGVNLKPDAMAEWLASDQLEFKAFSNSTTYEYEMARDFAIARGESGRVILRFEQLDRGTPVGFGSNRNSGELEVIVSDQKFDIVKKTYDPKQDVYVFDLRQAPKTDAVDAPKVIPARRTRDVNRFGSDGSDVKLIKR